MGLLYLYLLHDDGDPDAAKFRLFKIYHKCMFIQLSISHSKLHVGLLATSFDSKISGCHQVAAQEQRKCTYLLYISLQWGSPPLSLKIHCKYT